MRELFAQRRVAEPSDKWNSRRESNPDLFVRTEASSCVRPREHKPGEPMRAPHSASNWRGRSSEALRSPLNKWKGCRELNSDLKVRSLAPSIRWTTSPLLEGA